MVIARQIRRFQGLDTFGPTFYYAFLLFFVYQSTTSTPRPIQISRLQMNKKIDEIVACFNFEQAHFQGTPMLQTKPITCGHNLQVWGKYIGLPALRNPLIFLHFIPFLK